MADVNLNCDISALELVGCHDSVSLMLLHWTVTLVDVTRTSFQWQ